MNKMNDKEIEKCIRLQIQPVVPENHRVEVIDKEDNRFVVVDTSPEGEARFWYGSWDEKSIIPFGLISSITVNTPKELSLMGLKAYDDLLNITHTAIEELKHNPDQKMAHAFNPNDFIELFQPEYKPEDGYYNIYAWIKPEYLDALHLVRSVLEFKGFTITVAQRGGNPWCVVIMRK